MKEGKKVVGKQLPPDSVRMFWENKTRGKISNENEIQSEKVAKEREKISMNIENERKKAKTVKRKKKLQEDCVKMMTKHVEDWESEKFKEEEVGRCRGEEKDLFSSGGEDDPRR